MKMIKIGSSEIGKLLRLVFILCSFAPFLCANVKLRHDWTAGTLFTPLARKIQDNQEKCTKVVHYHKQNNWGMGSDIHTWSQTVCNSMQVDASLLQLNEEWIWNDKEFCKGATTNPLQCYFNLNTQCPNSKSGSPQIIPFKHEFTRCPKYITDDKSRQEFRAAAMEYLFSKLNKKLVKEAEETIVKLFGEDGIPNDMISVHWRWGDKKLEMKLVTVEEYVEAIDQTAANYSIVNPKVFITTESKHALTSIQTYVQEHRKHWTLYHYEPSVFETRYKVDEATNTTIYHNPMNVARHTGGSIGRASLVSLLLVLEAKYYILTSGSNWSRLIDELRRNVIDNVCQQCTVMTDLREAFRDHNWRIR